jgi:CelD/BcsL family acetyltransferase involved in cellulose biosynthesis
VSGEIIVQTEIYSTTEGFEALKIEWNELLHDSAADTIFLSYQWQTTWWKNLGVGTPLLIAVRDEIGRLLGLAPLFRFINVEEAWELSTIGCVDVSDYLDIIIRRGFENDVYAALLDILGRPDVMNASWDVISLCNIPQTSPTLDIFSRMAKDRGYRVECLVQEVCPIVTLPDTWDMYLQNLEGKERRELRRKMRKANPNNGVDWYIVGPEHDLDVEVETFIELMALSHQDKAGFLHDNHRNFIHQITREAWDAGWLELAFLTVRGQPAASMLNFVYRNRTLLYNSGLDAENFLRLSPGIVLTAQLVKHSIQEKREAFDFLRGDERYKYQLGGVDTTVNQLLIRK